MKEFSETERMFHEFKVGVREDRAAESVECDQALRRILMACAGAGLNAVRDAQFTRGYLEELPPDERHVGGPALVVDRFAQEAIENAVDNLTSSLWPAFAVTGEEVAEQYAYPMIQVGGMLLVADPLDGTKLNADGSANWGGVCMAWECVDPSVSRAPLKLYRTDEFERYLTLVGSIIWRGDGQALSLTALGWPSRKPEVIHLDLHDPERSPNERRDIDFVDAHVPTIGIGGHNQYPQSPDMIAQANALGAIIHPDAGAPAALRVVCAQYLGYFQGASTVWDTAGALPIQFAGGCVTDHFGNRLSDDMLWDLYHARPLFVRGEEAKTMPPLIAGKTEAACKLIAAVARSSVSP